MVCKGSVGIALGLALLAAGGVCAASRSQDLSSETRPPLDPVALREWFQRHEAACDDRNSSPAMTVQACTVLLDPPRMVGAPHGRIYARRAEARLALGDEAGARSDLDNALHHYRQSDPLPGTRPIEAPPEYQLPTPALEDNRRVRAGAYCNRADIRWRAGDRQGAEADFGEAEARYPGIACARQGLAGLARGAPAPALAAAAGRAQDQQRRAAVQVCASERMAAARAWFGGQADEARAAQLDSALEPLGVFSADLDTLTRNRAMFTESLAGDPRAQASEAYLVCLQTVRIRQIQPSFDFSRPVDLDGPVIETAELDDGALEAAPEDDIFANLPRRDAGAAAGLLSESLDPQARQTRRLRVAEDTRRRHANIQRRAENRAAFWNTLGEVLLVGVQTYAAVETARLELEAQQALALDRQRVAQAATPPPSVRNASPSPSGSMAVSQTGPRGYPYASNSAAIPYGSTPGCISFRMRQDLLGRYYDVVSSCSTMVHFEIGPPELMNPSESENRIHVAHGVFQPGWQRTLADNYFFVRSRYSAPQVLFACMDRNAAEQALGVTLRSIHFDYEQRTCIAVPSPPPQRAGTSN